VRIYWEDIKAIAYAFEFGLDLLEKKFRKGFVPSLLVAI